MTQSNKRTPGLPQASPEVDKEAELDEILSDIEEDWRDMDMGDHTFRHAKQAILALLTQAKAEAVLDGQIYEASKAYEAMSSIPISEGLRVIVPAQWKRIEELNQLKSKGEVL